MNVKNEYLFIGLLLSIVTPTVMAQAYFYNNYVKNYTHCSVKILDDNSVEVYFRAHLANNMSYKRRTDTGESVYESGETNRTTHDEHLREWAKIINLPNTESIALKHKDALVSLYFYLPDGTPDLTIRPQDISNISLNGTSPLNLSNSVRDIKFNTDNILYYSVSFTIPANFLKSIRIGATVGGTLASEEQEYPLLSSKGVSFGSSGYQCRSFNPQSGVAPQPLKIDPKFSLSAAKWQLKTLDLDHLLDTLTEDKSLHAPLIRPLRNPFCLNYRSMGTHNTRYMISANNKNGLSASGKTFQLMDKSNNSVIDYLVELTADGDAAENISLPKERKFIQLKNNRDGMEKMCWSPKIKVYSTKTTDKGSYSDTLNFTITPQA